MISDINAYDQHVRSQNGEDGVIEAIFAAIGTTDQFFVEFGCGPAVECNGAQLLSQGRTGLLMASTTRRTHSLTSRASS